ncbi:unnamed protein product [Staurois parvus]|uniref:Uncharacterized protein n=1 Tax=Staurois parvus TaxID=386267 RepID=A0ABN9FKD2_9NEOB|nr:unnamed protein product [Staurois parvus]
MARVPVWPPIAAVFHRHTLPCATFRVSLTMLGVVVCHGSLYGSTIAAVSIATLCHVPLSGLPHPTLLVCWIF